MATCVITNCRRPTPPDQPFCAKHKGTTEPVVDGAAEVRRALALCLTLAEPTPFTSDTARAVFLAGVQGEARRIVRALPDHVGRVETGKGEAEG